MIRIIAEISALANRKLIEEKTTKSKDGSLKISIKTISLSSQSN